MLKSRTVVLITVSLCLISGAFLWGVRKGGGTTGRPPPLSKLKAEHPAAATESPPIQVLVTKLQPSPGQFVYRYTVINGSAFPITDVQIGRDYFKGIVELQYAPSGWDGVAVPSSSYKCPPGWTFQNMASEEDSVAFLQWSTTRPNKAIMGGASLGGFEVTVPVYDLAYEAGSWTALMDSAEEPTYSAGLQPTGVTDVPISSLFAHSDMRISPNPARGTVEIKFAVPTAGPTTVDIFDVMGRRVRKIMSGRTPGGDALVSWDGRNDSGIEVAAGAYFVRVKTPATLRFGRITWLRSLSKH